MVYSLHCHHLMQRPDIPPAILSVLLPVEFQSGVWDPLEGLTSWVFHFLYQEVVMCPESLWAWTLYCLSCWVLDHSLCAEWLLSTLSWLIPGVQQLYLTTGKLCSQWSLLLGLVCMVLFSVGYALVLNWNSRLLLGVEHYWRNMFWPLACEPTCAWMSTVVTRLASRGTLFPPVHATSVSGSEPLSCISVTTSWAVFTAMANVLLTLCASCFLSPLVLPSFLLMTHWQLLYH